MKIKIITIHSIPNFGSVFQTYALFKYLKNIGYSDVEVIDYCPSYFEPHGFRSIVAMVLNLKKYILRRKKFRTFIEKNVCLTNEKYKNVNQLEKAKIDSDLTIAGGDQLWNVYHDCGNDDAYKLSFTSSRKISYGTSMGQTGFTMDQLNYLANKLKSFSHVSVRESSSVSLLSKVGIDAQWCVDPVYLLPADEYDKFVKPVPYEKYLLVYLVTPSPLLDKIIEVLSSRLNLKVILCSGFSRKCKCDIFLSDLGPDEILSYIKHAEIVLSASFHATTFSLIFEKQFFTILPDPSTNERIVDLLSKRNLLDRLITEQSELDSALSKTIDYSLASPYDCMIMKSKEYLNNALK